MKLFNKLKKRRGVAIIFALFTAALLVSMSATVVALAMHHSRDNGTASYSEAALHAANYGIEATINFMGNGNNWETTKAYQQYTAYPYGSHLKSVSRSSIGEGLSSVNVTNISPTVLASTLQEYGLSYTGGQKVGEDNYVTAHASGTKGGDTRIISFSDIGGSELKLQYLDGTYATVKVACTEYRFPLTNQPSQYQLVSVSKVHRPDVASKSLNSDSNSTVLATRVVECRVREETAADFMHFIQNARSWDVNGVDLMTNSDARTRVYLPTNYDERGRLRVDGYTTKDLTNTLKQTLKNYAGTLGFFLEGGSFNPSNYNFAGDVTTWRSSENFVTNKGNSISKQNIGKIFGNNSLHDGTEALGMPQAEDYFNYARTKGSDRTYTGNTTKVVNVSTGVTTGGTNARQAAYNSVHQTSGCPDVVANGNVPSFAVTRVVLGDSSNANGSNKVQVFKYNPALYSESQVASLGYNSSRVEKIYSGTSDNINNGVITVTGGNVEVVNASSYSSTAKDSTPACFTGRITIVSDVEANRDAVTNGGESANSLYDANTICRYNSTTKSNEYVSVARLFYEDNPYVNTPPYTETQLKNFAKSQGLDYKSSSSSSKTAIWPASASSTKGTSSQEREGNVYISSDLAYGQTGSSSPSIGIVAKNYILLNDRDGGKNLRVDAVLMSQDHSVQFDWNNVAKNPHHDNLVKTGSANKRTFKLNGAIVSGYLDVEGDASYRGYFTQNFQHDENLRYQLPPLFPRWDRSQLGGSTSWNWVVLSYQDNGTINQF